MPPAYKSLQWTAPKTALIELLYALHTEKVFNDGRIGIGEIASCLGQLFGIDLGQYSRAFLEIRARKSDRTKFLNALKESLIRRMDEADEK